MSDMRKKKRTTAPTAAVQVLTDAAVAHRLRRFEAGDDNFGEHAAAVLDVDPALVLKTLVVQLPSGLAVCCVPVTGRLALKKAAAGFGVRKAVMAEPRDAERATGYVTGGISPIGQRNRLPTLIDASVAGAPVVCVSGGRRGLEIELSAADLAAVTRGRFVELVG